VFGEYGANDVAIKDRILNAFSKCGIVAGLVISAFATDALADISLSPKGGRLGSRFIATLSMSGSCNGKSTKAVAIRIPEGFLSVEAKSKPGWTFRPTSQKFAHPHELGEQKVESGVSELVWDGGVVGTGEYDEFVFRGYIARDLSPQQRLYFPTVQSCADGGHVAWVDRRDTVNVTRQKLRFAPSIYIMEYNGLRIHPDERMRVARDGL
jgi:uncharacterized protein YcnI